MRRFIPHFFEILPEYVHYQPDSAVLTIYCKDKEPMQATAAEAKAVGCSACAMGDNGRITVSPEEYQRIIEIQQQKP